MARILLSLLVVLLILATLPQALQVQNQFTDTGTRALDYAEYHNYTDIRDELQLIANAHPDITRLRVIGTTWEGKDILALRITDNPMDEEEEAKVLIMGGHHANELPSVEVPMYIIQFLVGNYSSNSTVRKLVDSRDIWFVPLLNPDGRDYALSVDASWRKNRQPIDLDQDGSPEGIGVDLNRNYGHLWGELPGTSHDLMDRDYCGPEAFSENETKAIRSLANEQHFDISLSYHSYGQVIFYPWNNNIDTTSPRGDVLEAIASEIAERTGYTPTQGSVPPLGYPTTGDSDDWLYANTSCLPFTIELGTEYAPPTWQLEILCKENLQSALYAIDIADDPGQATLPDWTIMAYMAADADVDLESDGIADINEMEVSGSTDDVNIIALFDGRTFGDTKIYHIRKDLTGMNSVIISDVLDDAGSVIGLSTGEVDMSDAMTLKRFVNWTIVNYPAQHYFLDLWGHGKDVLSGCCLDGFGLMPVQDIGLALGGHHFDIVGLDACSMGHFETAFELQNVTDIFIGSEAKEPLTGWDYLSTTSSIIDRPNTDPSQVSSWIVADYLDKNSQYGYITLAAMDMHIFREDFLPLLSEFIGVSQDFLYSDYDKIWKARNLSDTFTAEQNTVDLYEFLGHLSDMDIAEPVEQRVDSLLEKKKLLIVESGHGLTFPNADTLAVYFPPASSQISSSYSNLGFTRGQWDEYLEYLKDPPQIPQIIPLEFPELQNTTGPYVFSVEIRGYSGAELSFHYRFDGGDWSSAEMLGTGNVFTATINGQPNGTMIDFYFLAKYDGHEITEPYGVKQGAVEYHQLMVSAWCDVYVSGILFNPDLVCDGERVNFTISCGNTGPEAAGANVTLYLYNSNGTVSAGWERVLLLSGDEQEVNISWMATTGNWSGLASIDILEVFDANTSNQNASTWLNVSSGSSLTDDDFTSTWYFVIAALLGLSVIPLAAFLFVHVNVKKKRGMIARRMLSQSREYIRTVEEFGVDTSYAYISLARAESAIARGAVSESIELSIKAKESATIALGKGSE